MRTSQGVAAQPLAASPFNSLPLQQVVRLEVEELIKGSIRRGLKQPSWIKAEYVNGNHLSIQFGHEQAAVLREAVSAFKLFERMARSTHLFPFGLPPGDIHIVGPKEISGLGCHAYRDSMFFGESDVSSAVFRKLLKKGLDPLGEIEHHVALD